MSVMLFFSMSARVVSSQAFPGFVGKVVTCDLSLGAHAAAEFPLSKAGWLRFRQEESESTRPGKS